MFNIVLLIPLICAYFYTAYFEAGNFNCEAGKYRALNIELFNYTFAFTHTMHNTELYYHITHCNVFEHALF